MRLDSFEVRRGSGGQGAHAGGDGVIRRIRFLEPMTVSVVSNHRRVPPAGLFGGSNGAPGRNRIVRAGGEEVDLGGVARVAVSVDDELIIETPGGGGFGIH